MTRKELEKKENPLDLLVKNPNLVNDDDDDDDEEEDEDYCPSEDEEAAGLSLTEMLAGRLHQAHRTNLQPLVDFDFCSGEDEDQEDDLAIQSNIETTSSAGNSNELLQLTDEKKKRADELWAELNSLSRPKKLPTANNAKSSTSILTNKDNKVESEKSSSSLFEVKASKSDSDRPTTKISKVYDFAGESVVVEEEVSIQSANTESKQNETKANEGNRPRSLVPPKRTSGLGSLVSSLTKKPKMSTLTKTKLDWDSFKKDEGLEDELRNHRKNKDNFVDKQAFLLRADLKQFEQEKAVREKRRLAQSK